MCAEYGHDLSGHGVLDMTEAAAESCNTYYIELSKHIDSRLLIETAQRLGFGRSIPLALGMTVSGGSLQTEEDLSLQMCIRDSCKDISKGLIGYSNKIAMYEKTIRIAKITT